MKLPFYQNIEVVIMIAFLFLFFVYRYRVSYVELDRFSFDIPTLIQTTPIVRTRPTMSSWPSDAAMYSIISCPSKTTFRPSWTPDAPSLSLAKPSTCTYKKKRRWYVQHPDRFMQQE